MSEGPAGPTTTVLSVRAQAHRDVEPDRAVVRLELDARATTEDEARGRVDRRLDRLTSDLRTLGGEIRSADTLDAPLTWVVDRRHTWRDDGERFGAQLGVSVHVRDFALLPGVEAAGTGDGCAVEFVSWDVDDDNAAWPQVRSDAIDSAVRKGRDYATALGGELLSVEHVADAGLLGASAEAGVRFEAQSDLRMAKGSDGSMLNPQPLRISAVVEARFVATSRPLR